MIETLRKSLEFKAFAEDLGSLRPVLTFVIIGAHLKATCANKVTGGSQAAEAISKPLNSKSILPLPPASTRAAGACLDGPGRTGTVQMVHAIAY